MTSPSEAITRWVDVELGRAKRYLSCRNVLSAPGTVYSYGRHFPMAHALRDRKGQLRLFLLNGDVWGPTTSRHQGALRGDVDRSGVPSVIVPFSALDAAGVDPMTVKLVHRTEDRHETIHHTSWVQPDGSVWRHREVHETQRRSDEELQAICERQTAERMEQWERYHQHAAEDPDGYWAKYWLPDRSVEEYPYEVTIDDLDHWDTHHTVVVGTEPVLYASARTSYQTITTTDMGDGRTRYEWDTHRHWLGESLLHAAVPFRGFTICRSCRRDGQSTGTLPEAPPRPRHEEFANSWQFHDAVWAWRERYRCPDCSGEGGRHWARRRWAFFLSGFDSNEPRPSYFFCELPPRVHPTTIEEAYDALKPDTVKLAEQMGRQVKRQGDIFAVPLSNVTKRDLTRKGATYEKRGQLLGTNHEATEVAHMPDGTTLVRGRLVHNPRWRRPDHRPVPVGKHWHLILKNTVPVSA